MFQDDAGPAQTDSQTVHTRTVVQTHLLSTSNKSPSLRLLFSLFFLSLQKLETGYTQHTVNKKSSEGLLLERVDYL